jgi:hypothetical protein
VFTIRVMNTVNIKLKKMTEYSYILEPYNGMKSRYTCPNCGAKQSFAKYINSDTKEYLSDDVGRCNREEKCGYHYTPKQYFSDNKMTEFKPITYKPKPTIQKEPDFIEAGLFTQSLKAYDKNNFVSFLIGLFGAEVTNELVAKYYIGTSKKWNGATIFWQIDEQMKVRTGKIMLYNPETGKRIKEPYNHFSWVHKNLNKPDFSLNQSLFGLHLMKGNRKPIAVVESEKTAIISSVYLPDFIWLATGGLNNLSKSRFEPLRNRKVVLYPDLGAFDKWSEKTKELKSICSISISDLLEQVATEKERDNGFDIADYLIRFNQQKTTNENDRIRKITKQIAEFEKRIAEAKQLNRDLEHSFREVAMQTEFYQVAPKYIKEPKGTADKIKELMYWVS